MFSDYNLFDYIITFDSETRKLAKDQYFNISFLRLKMDDFKKNNPSKDPVFRFSDPRLKEKQLEQNKKRNSEVREVIRRINNQLLTADLSIMSIYAYFAEMLEHQNSSEERTLIEILFRRECSRACSEYYSIKENFKTVINTLYEITPKRGDKNFLDKVKPLTTNDNRLELFHKQSLALSNNQAYKDVIKIRTAETHGIPCLDEMTDIMDFDGNGTLVGGPCYVIKSENLYQMIRAAYQALIPLKDSLQAILDNIKI